MSEAKKTVLIIDDARFNVLVLEQILSPEYAVYTQNGGPEGIKAAKEILPDIILLDIVMPEMDGFEVISALKNSDITKGIPIIFITGLNDDIAEEKGLTLGAVDYITKPFSPTVVKLRVKNQMKILEQMRIIESLSLTDQLTGLPNRRSCDVQFATEWSRALRERTPLSILLIDVDRFKDYNDTHGHHQGDVALQIVAVTLRRTLQRAIDFVGRWGGEEFIALLPNTDAKGAEEVAEKIRKCIEDMEIPSPNKSASKVTVSIGINTLVDGMSDTTDNFFLGADTALYAAKNSGRNKACHSKFISEPGA